MAARAIVVMLLTTLLAPMVSAELIEETDFGFGATLSDNPDDAPLTYEYSPAIRAAFTRVSELSQYSTEERDS
ncbi:MAG: hypothetical protein VXV95_04530, partial [Candidatus Thermoplasmatota archaeon]|nr:hypothetical protein [Candidatus Thermoplasmatota archaeon]